MSRARVTAFLALGFALGMACTSSGPPGPTSTDGGVDAAGGGAIDVEAGPMDASNGSGSSGSTSSGSTSSGSTSSGSGGGCVSGCGSSGQCLCGSASSGCVVCVPF